MSRTYCHCVRCNHRSVRRLTNQVREVEVEQRVETVAAAAVAALLVVEMMVELVAAKAGKKALARG